MRKKPLISSSSKLLKPKKKQPFTLKMILGIVVLGIVLLGGVAGLVLGQMNQDTRQQAYEPVPTCNEAGGNCRGGSSCGGDVVVSGKCGTGTICCKVLACPPNSVPAGPSECKCNFGGAVVSKTGSCPEPTCQANGNTCQFYSCATGFVSATGTCGITTQKCCKPAPTTNPTSAPAPTCVSGGNICKTGVCGVGFKSAPGTCRAGSDEVCCKAHFCPALSSIQSATTCLCTNGTIIARNGTARCPNQAKLCGEYTVKANCNAAADLGGECGWSETDQNCTSNKIKLCGELSRANCKNGISGIQCKFVPNNYGPTCVPK